MKTKLSLFSALSLVAIAGSANAAFVTVDMGRSSNALGAAELVPDRVAANGETGVVAHIHRQDVTIWGGGTSENGKMRIDWSTDGGESFLTDLGPLNNTYSRPAREASIALHNPAGNTDPANVSIVWLAATLSPDGSMDGYVFGVGSVDGSAWTGTEEYVLLASDPPTGSPSPLVEGRDGEFWWTSVAEDGSVSVYKAVVDFETGASVVTLHTSTSPVYADFATHGAIGPVIQFSPDGEIGWIAYLSDLAGGDDDAHQPLVMHSTNGGQDWTDPSEITLNDLVMESSGLALSDALDELGETASVLPSTTYELDMTVDAFGEAHIVVAAANRSTPYAVSVEGLGSILLEISSAGLGTSWEARQIALLSKLRGEFGTPDPEEGALIAQDNSIQISRDPAGEHVFFSWVDTTFDDVVGNVAPDLHIAARRLSDDALVGAQNLSGDDLLWGGYVLWPDLGPEVVESDGGFELPIVFAHMIVNDQLSPTQHYGVRASIGADAFPEETGEDAGDVGEDVGPDVGEDVGPDTGEDVGPDVSDDVGDDVEPGDVGEDVEIDATDVGEDTADVGEDTEPDTETDTETDTEEDATTEDVLEDAVEDAQTDVSAPAPANDSGCASSRGNGSALGFAMLFGTLLRRRRS